MKPAIDPNSPTWDAVKAAVAGAIEASRTKLEMHGTETAVTEFERGRISAMREILGLASPRAPLPVSGNVYT